MTRSAHKSQRIAVVIPARYGSSRFPGKPLAVLAGKPVIQHVFERASELSQVEQVIVATDDIRIRDLVEGFGGTAVMTDPALRIYTTSIVNLDPTFEVEIKKRAEPAPL